MEIEAYELLFEAIMILVVWISVIAYGFSIPIDNKYVDKRAFVIFGLIIAFGTMILFLLFFRW